MGSPRSDLRRPRVENKAIYLGCFVLFSGWRTLSIRWIGRRALTIRPCRLRVSVVISKSIKEPSKGSRFYPSRLWSGYDLQVILQLNCFSPAYQPSVNRKSNAIVGRGRFCTANFATGDSSSTTRKLCLANLIRTDCAFPKLCVYAGNILSR